MSAHYTPTTADEIIRAEAERIKLAEKLEEKCARRGCGKTRAQHTVSPTGRFYCFEYPPLGARSDDVFLGGPAQEPEPAETDEEFLCRLRMMEKDHQRSPFSTRGELSRLLSIAEDALRLRAQ